MGPGASLGLCNIGKMNFLKSIYPLWLREKIYFHTVFRSGGWPKAAMAEVPLALAPAKLTALLHTDLSHRELAWNGFYELELSRRISTLATEGGIMVDVGANVGYFTCIWASINPANKVYAYEPSPRNLAMLRQNVSMLDNPERVHISEQALSNVEGRVSFDLGPEHQSCWGGLTEADRTGTINVEARRLDLAFTSQEPIAVLKIDTEGADTWVLFGAQDLLKVKSIRNIFFECNPERMAKLGIGKDEAEKFLLDLGYRIESIAPSEYWAYLR